jgi:hypothetical protein
MTLMSPDEPRNLRNFKATYSCENINNFAIWGRAGHEDLEDAFGSPRLILFGCVEEHLLFKQLEADKCCYLLG